MSTIKLENCKISVEIDSDNLVEMLSNLNYDKLKYVISQTEQQIGDWSLTLDLYKHFLNLMRLCYYENIHGNNVHKSFKDWIIEYVDESEEEYVETSGKN
jgi:hypothetical protein